MLLFGQKLRYLRQSASLSQVRLAQDLGYVTQAHISQLEAGHKEPSLSLAIQIALLFGVSLDYLLNDTLPFQPAVYTRLSHPTKEAFSVQLRRIRKSKKLTQGALAQKLGLKTQSHISLLEKQYSEPSIDLVLRLSEVLNVSIRDLFEFPEEGEL